MIHKWLRRNDDDHDEGDTDDDDDKWFTRGRINGFAEIEQLVLGKSKNGAPAVEHTPDRTKQGRETTRNHPHTQSGRRAVGREGGEGGRGGAVG